MVLNKEDLQSDSELPKRRTFKQALTLGDAKKHKVSIFEFLDIKGLAEEKGIEESKLKLLKLDDINMWQKIINATMDEGEPLTNKSSLTEMLECLPDALAAFLAMKLEKS